MAKIRNIVLHYSASGDVSAATIDGWHKARGWRGIGYHFVIRRDGKIEDGRQLDDDNDGFIDIAGAHTLGMNRDSIGICVVGSDLEPWFPAAAQYEAARRLVSQLRRRFDISDASIFLHKEKAATACPGRLSKGLITGTAPPAADDGLPVIRRGSRGAYVRIAQERLKAHHAGPGPIDGDFGPKTSNAVWRFQRARWPDDPQEWDRVVGPKTWALLLQAPGK